MITVGELGKFRRLTMRISDFNEWRSYAPSIRSRTNDAIMRPAEREADADGVDQQDQAFRQMEMGQSGLQQDVFLFAHLAGISAGVMVTTPGQPRTRHIPGRFGKLTAKSRFPLPESAAFVRN